MKNHRFIILVLVFTMFFNSCNSKNQDSKESDSPTKENTYFGQKPPGLESEPLERGILTKEGWKLGGEFTPEK